MTKLNRRNWRCLRMGWRFTRRFPILLFGTAWFIWLVSALLDLSFLGIRKGLIQTGLLRPREERLARGSWEGILEAGRRKEYLLQRPNHPIQAVGNPYLDSKAFQALPLGKKLRLVALGTWAFYSDAIIVPQWLFNWSCKKLEGFRLAYYTYKAIPKADCTLSHAYHERIRVFVRRRDYIQLIEYWFAFRRPDLTAVTTRPLYKILGGNRRPFLSLMGTHLYTALFSHHNLLEYGCYAALGAMIAAVMGGDAGHGARLALLLPLGEGALWMLGGLLILSSKGLRQRSNTSGNGGMSAIPVCAVQHS